MANPFAWLTHKKQKRKLGAKKTMQNLYKHQAEFLQKNPDCTALVWSCGLGKTLAACMWGKQKGGTTLIICPKALRETWTRQAEDVNLMPPSKEYGQYIFSKEEFRKDADKLKKFDNVIVDEYHSAGFVTPHGKSQMAQAFKNYLKTNNVKRILMSSATPGQNPWQIYQLATLLGYRIDWQKFKYTFFTDVRMGARTIPVAKKGMEAKLAHIVKQVSDVVALEDTMDVPPQVHSDPELYELTKEQKIAIDNAYDPVPIVRYTKQHEIENGILKDPDTFFPSEKLERIKQLVEEHPKIAIVCRYNLQIDSIKQVIPNALVIRGDTKDRDALTHAADAATEAVVLIQADTAEGYELPSFPICVFASMSYSYSKFVQVCGRFLRINAPSKTVFLYLITEGDSIDKAVWEAIQRKEDFQIELYAREK